MTASAFLAGSTILGGWKGEAISVVIGFSAGLLILSIPKVRHAKTWQRVLLGGVAGVIIYLIVSFLMGYFFHERLD